MKYNSSSRVISGVILLIKDTRMKEISQSYFSNTRIQSYCKKYIKDVVIDCT